MIITGHLPPEDDIQHELTDDCPCGPSSLPVVDVDGVVGWVIVHHSLDGREQRE
jgi:hypothetical protein